MNFRIRPNIFQNTKALVLLTSMICLVMLYAGLRPKGFRLYNQVSWKKDKDGNGILFGKRGIAYINKKPGGGPALPKFFSIDLVFKTTESPRKLSTMLHFRGENCPIDFKICQWDSNLIFYKMNRGFLKDNVKEFGFSFQPDKTHLLSISSSSKTGTSVSLDGVIKGNMETFGLCDPESIAGEIVLGNSATGQSPWQGEILGLSIQKNLSSAMDVQHRFQHWRETGSLVVTPVTLGFYSFAEQSGHVITDRVGAIGNLYNPEIFFIPSKQVLTMPWKDFELNRAYFSDILMNGLGFIPFGFVFFALLGNLKGFYRRHQMLICVLTGSGFSLFLELVQVYMPSRDSQMSDWILNTAGAFIGVIVGRRLLRGSH